jgi:hypothetical protein
MRYTSLAVFLGSFLLLANPGIASAQEANMFLYGGTNGPNCIAALTCRLHQHGPLYNYGPYYGYPPFEPYGPWNAYLQYNPWYYGYPQGHCQGGGPYDLAGHGGICNGWSLDWHSSWSLGGWYHGCSTCSHGGLFTSFGGWSHGHATPGCNSCGIVGSVTPSGDRFKATVNPQADPASRYAGAGNATDFAVFYSGLPTLSLTAVPAGGIAK